MSNYEAMEILRNTFIEQFNDLVERIKNEDYDDLIELAKLSAKAEAYKEVIISMLQAKELTL